MSTFEEIRSKYFDPDRAPYAIGLYVSEIYQATPTQLRRAGKLLRDRRRRYPWRRLPDQEANELIEKSDSKTGFCEIWALDLPFYAGPLAPVRLLHFEAKHNAPEGSMRVLIDSEAKMHPLDGSSPPIHAFNKLVAATNNGVAVSNEKPGAVEEYLSFFCSHLSSNRSFFYIIEEDDRDGLFRLIPASHDEREDLRLSRDKRESYSSLIRVAYPITQTDRSDTEDLEKETFPPLLASVVFSNELSRAVFTVFYDGNVKMTSSQTLENVIINPIQSTWLPRE